MRIASKVKVAVLTILLVYPVTAGAQTVTSADAKAFMGTWVINVDAGGPISVDLTVKEFDLLLQFAGHPGRVYSRQQLLDLVWGYGHAGYEHTVNSHINRLRGKIERDPANPEYVLTVWGVGYKFAEGAPNRPAGRAP